MGKRFDKSWEPILGPLLGQSYMVDLSFFVQQARDNGQVFPPQDLVFNAFRLTTFDSLKVVILGQDPYHNDGQAHGLAFSVPEGIALPPSLKNIFKELETDILDFKIPKSGDLSYWGKQGVLLLNATLTVNAHQAGSHQKKGWEKFTDQVIQAISENKEAVVFLLWGAYAQKKASLINAQKHLVLTAVHPSPLSVYRGFFGCRHFSQTNVFLQQRGEKPIDWKLI
ncbi:MULTISPECIES: uracil-DNA glycosylase [unclassified Sphingobacterium]|uniref:uracil-DNA glycosylase n=1 Tax=unclassified Sphingobacterium TaxID=2609468 RepID=UPI0014396B16|nr:uracil-DNA glycosylase [Sphingobacterium sp. B16(2022)]NJI74805.1 uracil-DNA glycosylase [Sphingobacterium sp. B16(2022)]